MARQIDYPRASLKNTLELAQAIDDLGGKSSTDMAADKMNKKVSGAFQALIGSASKFGLVTSKKGQLEVTELYREYKLAYSKEEAGKILIEAFLTPPLFGNIFERFNGRELPVAHFEKLLIREFGVPDQISSRVSKYFLEGAKQCALLGTDNVLRVEAGEEDDTEEQPEANRKASQPHKDTVKTGAAVGQHGVQDQIAEDGKFSVRIKGPGMDSVIVVNEEEDLLIIRAMLKKVEKKFSEYTDEPIWGDDA